MADSLVVWSLMDGDILLEHSPCLSPQAVVGGLLTPEDDHSLLISQFCEYLEYDDIRYHTMQAATSTVAQATSQQSEVSPTVWNNAFILLSAVNLPLQEHDLTKFYVKHTREF